MPRTTPDGVPSFPVFPAPHGEEPSMPADATAIMAALTTLNSSIDRLSGQVQAVDNKLSDHALRLEKIPTIETTVTKLEGRVEKLETTSTAAALAAATGGVKGNLLWQSAVFVLALVGAAIIGALVSTVVARPVAAPVVVTSH